MPFNFFSSEVSLAQTHLWHTPRCPKDINIAHYKKEGLGKFRKPCSRHGESRIYSLQIWIWTKAFQNSYRQFIYPLLSKHWQRLTESNYRFTTNFWRTEGIFRLKIPLLFFLNYKTTQLNIIAATQPSELIFTRLQRKIILSKATCPG